MILRPFREGDRDYIVRSVIMSYLSGSKYAQKIHKDAYMRAHSSNINNLIDHASVIVMADPDQEDLVYGFAIFENLPFADVLHYFYMRKDFRKKGLASQLLASIKKSPKLAYSHLTEDFKPGRLKNMWEKCLFDPHLMIGPNRRH